MSRDLSLAAPPQDPTRVRYGVLGFACSLSMITYLDRVCFGTVAPFIQSEFGLSDTQKGLLFSAFALAYAIFEVPSGWLGDMFGPRKTLIRIVLWWSTFTALTGLIWPIPEVAWFAFAAMLFVRFMFGVGEAGAYPNIARALHNWFPFTERGFAQGAVWMAGRFAGGVTHLIVGALLIHVTIAGSTVIYWRHTFWLFGVLGVLWCVAFWWWFRDRPDQKPEVNQAELDLIRADEYRLPPVTTEDGEGERIAAGLREPSRAETVHGGPPPSRPLAEDEAITDQPPPEGAAAAANLPPRNSPEDLHSHAGVPWMKLLTNGNLWVLCMMYFCAAYGWYFNITWLPGYLRSEYGVTEGEWGFWTSSLMAGAPLLLGSVACLLGGALTDSFIRRTGNRKWGRRLYGVIGHGLCAGCYFAAAFAGNAWLFVLFIALAAFWNDMTMGSAWASCLDIGKRYSAIVAGCMNTIGNLGGAVAGYATGLILELNRGDVQTGWTINFLIFGGVYVVATFLWLRFDSTRPVVPDETP
ncbi:MAG: MFS transporter [Gemmataceae bacterium]|nr:MFS transporter [Gemmataceae bacterium]